MDLGRSWVLESDKWIAWARTPMHDSYWRFHRDQFLELLPPPGRLTLDIGSGEGRLARHLGTLGHRVVAFDYAWALVAAGQSEDPTIPTLQADASRLPLRDGVADLAVAFMSLQDVDEMPAAVKEAERVLTTGGQFCIAIVHPLNSAGNFGTDEPDSPFVIEGSYLDVFRYQEDIERDDLQMSFVSEHRPMHVYFEALEKAGFLVLRVREPPVPAEAVENARSRRWQRVPLFLHISALKRGAVGT
jgi:SAM-dependent methyltransferase